MSTELPLRVEQLDRDWLAAALGPRFGGEPPQAVTHDAVLEGTATKVRLQLHGAGPGWPASVIVKAGFAAHRERMEAIYAKEVRAYRDVLPQVGIEVPTCWLAADDAAGHQHLLVLEDLTGRGVQFCRLQQPLNFNQAAAFLDALARLHARWWGDTAAFAADGGALAGLPRWQPLPALPEGAYQWGQIEPAVWQSFIRLPRGVAVPKALHDRERMRAALLALQDFNAHGEDCLIHGDAHLGNLYLTPQGGAGILDWQTFMRGPWHHDVGYFMVSSLDVPDRRRWEQPLLMHYLARLQAHAVQQPPCFDEAFEAYRRQPVNGLYFWLVNPIEFQEELNNCAVAPRFAMAALDLDSFALLGV